MDSITLRTTIKRGLKRFLIIRGSLLALIGITLLVYSGAFISPQTLTNWGIALWLVSFFFIAWGLIPYKRITKLESNPNTLTVTNDGNLHYLRHGHDLLTFPLKSITKIKYVEEKGLYGIAVDLDPEDEPHIPNPPLSVIMQMFLIPMKKRHKFDRFFPYFSERTARELNELIIEAKA
jgi:hypothetical protein